VLNVQLLRFVYDTKEGIKKKLTGVVSFPLELDTTKHCSLHTKSAYDKSNLYQLTAVLLHIGTSANGGHYIAHIRDELYGFSSLNDFAHLYLN